MKQPHLKKKPHIDYGIFETPLGHILLAATDKGICCIQFADNPAASKNNLYRDFPDAEIGKADISADNKWRKWMKIINSYLGGQPPSGDCGLENLPINSDGTEFQNRVWDYLRSIPYGTTRSYSDIANAIGKPKAARASSRACATNKIGLAIPCHRIVCSDGSISGYRWGVDRKRKLLAIEETTSFSQGLVKAG